MEDEFPSSVERSLILHDHETDQKVEIRLVIGHPYWTEPGMEAACPVAMYGYFGRLSDIRNIDPMGALALAIHFLESLLKGLPKTRTVYWPSGKKYFDE